MYEKKIKCNQLPKVQNGSTVLACFVPVIKGFL